MTTVNPIYIEPWEASKPGILNKGVRAFAITAIVIGVLAVLAEMVIIGLALGGVLPTTGVWGWILSYGSFRTLVLAGSGIALIAIGSVLMCIRGQLNKRTARKVEERWAEEQVSAHAGGPAFTVGDQPSIEGMAWAEEDKPRVLLISSKEGGGHGTAAIAATDALKADYFVKTIFPTGELKASQWFNWCQRGGWKRIQKGLVNFQWYGGKLGIFGPINKEIRRQILLHKPQMIISVQPVTNAFTHYIAKQYHIPLLVIPTDYKTDHFFYGFDGANDDFRIGLPFDDEEEITRLKELYGFEDSHFHITGYPVRPAFQDEKADEIDAKVAELKALYNIQDEDHIILISMGAQGGKKLKDYCQEIANADFAEVSDHIHVFALCGKNDDLKEEIEGLQEEEAFTIQSIGWIDGDIEMAAYTKLAKVYITKPGGGSTSEGVASRTYLYFNGQDARITPWEPVNMKKVEDWNVGEEIKPETFISRLIEILKNDGELPEVDFPGRNFGENLHALVDVLVQE